MKTLLLAASLLALTSTAIAADVGVSINIGQPGFYGRIDIGDFPQPQVLYAQPIIIRKPARYVEQAPIYLRVPPGHAKKWSKHCAAYNACGQRVYFVQEQWYTQDYSPHYREQHGDRHEQDQNNRDDRHDDKKDHGKKDKKH